MSDDGGAAFPVSREQSPSNWGQPSAGMSLRDYFAAKALCGMMAGDHYAVITGIKKIPSEAEAMAARCAYAIADAMLKARNQP